MCKRNSRFSKLDLDNVVETILNLLGLEKSEGYMVSLIKFTTLNKKGKN